MSSTVANPVRLAIGVVALEFAAAVSRFVASTLLPTIAPDLGATGRLGLLLTGGTLGLFVALPLATRVMRALGPRRTLAAGLAAYVGGAATSAAAPDAYVFAAGQFAGGLGGGTLAVFGFSAIIRHLDGALRVKVVAASSAMWIVPALVGPPATLGLEHAVGWRWALLLPLPIVLAGRLLVARVATRAAEPEPDRPRGLTLLIPLGVGTFVLAGPWPVLAAAGLAVGLVGVVAIMPPGTARLARGTPAALAALLLFGVGYFGADGLITVMLTSGYGVDLRRAAVVLSAAPLAWAVTSLLVPRIGAEKRTLGVAGLALAAAGTAAVAILSGPQAYAGALVSWACVGIGVGLAYPGLYVLASTVDRAGLGPVQLAAAVITSETFGGLLGQAAGGALAARSLPLTYALLAGTLAAAAVTATRSQERRWARTESR